MKLDLTGQPLEFQPAEWVQGTLFQTKQRTYHLLISPTCAGRVSVLTFDKEGKLTGVQTYGASYLDTPRFVGCVDLNLKPEWITP